jgi:tRNA(Arg) A34 adenosine deaminase TadA
MDDLAYLQRCVVLAEEALDRGDEPFGSVLVDGRGVIRREATNRAVTMDRTQHPEFELVRWAVESLDEKERAEATVYTSGEHCPMCSAAHAWAGLGPIVYAVSGASLAVWHKEWDVPASPVAGLGVDQVAPHVPTRGPFPLLEDTMKALHHGVRRTTD